MSILYALLDTIIIFVPSVMIMIMVWHERFENCCCLVLSGVGKAFAYLYMPIEGWILIFRAATVLSTPRQLALAKLRSIIKQAAKRGRQWEPGELEDVNRLLREVGFDLLADYHFVNYPVYSVCQPNGFCDVVNAIITEPKPDDEALLSKFTALEGLARSRVGPDHPLYRRVCDRKAAKQ